MNVKISSILLSVFLGINHGILLSQVPIESRADSVLHKLLEGNKKYISENFNHPRKSLEQYTEAFEKKRPFAVILGCSDSRVPPEIIFNQGIGDLYVIRVAGNIVDDAVLGSIEYAVLRLGAPLIIVLGHKQCGIINMLIKKNKIQGHINNLIKAIKPALKAAKEKDGALLDNTIKLNVQEAVSQIKSSTPVLNDLSKKGVIRIVGAYYDFDNGKVELLF